MEKFTQDPDAHLFYEVDWAEWLENRGYTAADIVSTEFTAPEGVTITHQTRDGAKARVWLKDLAAGKSVRVSCRINMPPPAQGVDLIMDDYSFEVRGKSK